VLECRSCSRVEQAIVVTHIESCCDWVALHLLVGVRYSNLQVLVEPSREATARQVTRQDSSPGYTQDLLTKGLCALAGNQCASIN